MNTSKSFKHRLLALGAVLLGSFAFSSAQAQSFTNLMETYGPIYYWRLNDVATSPAQDVVTNYGSTGPSENGYVEAGYDGQTSGGIVGSYIILKNGNDGGDEDLGGTTNRVDIPWCAALNPNPPFTIEFWAKPASYYAGAGDSVGLCPLSSLTIGQGANPNDTRCGYLFYASASQWQFRTGGYNSYSGIAGPTASGTVTPGVWEHIVGTFDGTNQNLYINGVLAATTPANPTAPFTPNLQMPTRIGGTALTGDSWEDGAGGNPPGVGNRGWDGGFDELAIYGSILSSNTILSHYNTAINTPGLYKAAVLASSPLGYWDFDEPAYVTPSPSNTLALDIGSLGFEGTNTLGNLASQPGVPDLGGSPESVFYNGVIGGTLIETNSPYQFNDPSQDTPQPITMAAWVKANAGSWLGEIISQGPDMALDGYGEGANWTQNYLVAGAVFSFETFNDDFSLGDVSDLGGTQLLGPPIMQGNVQYYSFGAYEGSSGPNGGEAYADAFSPIYPGDYGNWVFLVGTYDVPSSTWNLYRNGNLVAQQFDYFDEGPVYVNDQSWAVGSRSDPAPAFGAIFDGQIEEASVFNTELTADQISDLYQSVHQPPVITIPLAYTPPVYLGEDLLLSVYAEGPGTLTYQWYSNNMAISDTATNYEINPTVAASDATYSVVVSNAYGSATSSLPIFITPTLPPIQLTPGARWEGFTDLLQPVSLPNFTLSYQWESNGAAILGATSTNYPVIATPALDNVSWSLIISNSLGAATSAPVMVTAVPIPSGYVAAVLSNSPMAFLMLNETNPATVAYDFAGGNNGEDFDVTLGDPSFSEAFPQYTSTGFAGQVDSYVGDIGQTTINFPGEQTFSVEAWGNGGGSQEDGAPVVVKGAGNNGTSDTEQFAIDVSGGVYEFFLTDSKNSSRAQVVSSVQADGNWHYFVGTFDPTSGQYGLVHFYVDGREAATSPESGPIDGDIATQDPVSIGAGRSGVDPAYDLDYDGDIAMVAIYNTLLSLTDVSNHYAAAYGGVTYPTILSQPVSVTNYAGMPVNSNLEYGNLAPGFPATFKVDAVGSQPLTYSWYKQGSGTPIQTGYNNQLLIAPLALSNSGTYYVVVQNGLGPVTSQKATLTVLPAPATPPSIPGLVAHLKFETNLVDSTGRGNNATNTGYGAWSNTASSPYSEFGAGVLGSAYYYITQTNTTQTNSTYANFGNRPDFQFGTGSFTVAMWINMPYRYDEADLPFFCDVTNSTFGEPGFCMEASYGPGTPVLLPWPGSWGCSFLDASGNGIGEYGYPDGIMNDGNWHHLIYDVNTAPGGGLTVYLDGTPCLAEKEAGTTAVGVGSLSTTAKACIGQDPTGKYGQASSPTPFGIDDFCVFDRALTPFECETIYAANAFGQLSIGNSPPLQSTLSFANGNLTMTFNEGYPQFATNVLGPWTTLAVNSPYTVDVTTQTNVAGFYRIKW